MAKEFKTWDKAFTKEEIQEELKVWNALIRGNIVNYWQIGRACVGKEC